MNAQENGSWASPSTWLKAIKEIGLPYSIIVFLLLVGLGIIPTAYFVGLQMIPKIWGAAEGQTEILKDIREITITSCEFQAPDKDAVQKCRPRSK